MSDDPNVGFRADQFGSLDDGEVVRSLNQQNNSLQGYKICLVGDLDTKDFEISGSKSGMLI